MSGIPDPARSSSLRLPEGEVGSLGEVAPQELNAADQNFLTELESEISAGWADLTPRDLIKEANKISLIGIFQQHHVSFETVYSPSGWIHKTHCPFPNHRDSSPSFWFNPKENVFKCFGCQKKGSTVLFLAYLQNREPEEIALELLQEEGLEKLEITQYENKLVTALPDLMEAAAQFQQATNLALMEKITGNLDAYVRSSVRTERFTKAGLQRRIGVCHSLIKDPCDF